MRRSLAVLAALLVLAAGYAAERSVDSVLGPVHPAKAWRPSPVLPGDSLREAYRVRLNGKGVDLARFASRGKPQDVARASGDDLSLLHADGSGGTVYWLSRSERIPLDGPLACGDAPGADPGGIRPPNARRLLCAVSDRADRLASALYQVSPGGLRALYLDLRCRGWVSSDSALWTRGRETLLVEPGPPGAALVYWRLPGGDR